MTLGEFSGLWLETYVAPFRAESTVACYRRALGSFSGRVLDCDLMEFDFIRAQMDINRKAAQSPRAAQLMYTVLCLCLRRAAGVLRVSVGDPEKGLVRPVHAGRRAEVLTVDELRAYCRAAMLTPCGPLLVLGACTGLRRGELLGLKHKDFVPVDGGYMMSVSRQRLRVDGQYITKGPKTVAGCRSIFVPSDLAERLPIHGAPEQWLVSTTPERLRDCHRLALHNAGVNAGVTLHGLRHSYATAQAVAGVPLTVLQYVLGHSSMRITADLYAGHTSGADTVDCALMVL